MRTHCLRLWCVAVALLVSAPGTHSRELTLYDIKDAILSLVRIVRLSEDKLERHESREKLLGDQLKRHLMGLDKKHQALEPLKGMISRLDDRLSNVETILLQKEEPEKNAHKKTNEALENIQKSIQKLAITLEKQQQPPEIDNNLTINDDALAKLDMTTAKLDAVKKEIEGLKERLNVDALHRACLDMVSNPIERHISNAEKLLNNYELKLNEYNVSKVQTDIVPLSEIAFADEAWHNKMVEVMERQEVEVKKIKQLLSDAEGMWKDLPRKADLQLATNQTLEAIVNATEISKENEDKSVTKVTTKLREMGERMTATNEDIQRSLTQGNTFSEHAFTDILQSYGRLREDLQGVSRNEQLLLQTSDSVKSNKKAIEYGVRQIRMEVGEMIFKNVKNVNKTISDRLDHIEKLMSEHHIGGMGNLSAKIETEMAQVWRQIGIMHQHLMGNKATLQKLSDESERYANSSTATIKKVQEEVTGINEHIAQLTDNMNYALGRLSLVTHEFGEISKGIEMALAGLRKDVRGVPVKDEGTQTGPGPHPIPSEDRAT